jgi:hypothetical protein
MMYGAWGSSDHAESCASSTARSTGDQLIDTADAYARRVREIVGKALKAAAGRAGPRRTGDGRLSGQRGNSPGIEEVTRISRFSRRTGLDSHIT